MIDLLLTDPEKVLSDLEYILPEIIRGLEHGLQKARAYFDRESVRFDAAAFSVLVRLHAREHLQQKSLETDEIEIEKVNLCGLWLRQGIYQLKIWKIGRDDLKKGLDSEAYINAPQMSLILDDLPLLGFGLAVFWTADALRHLDQVHLVHQLSDDPRCFEGIWYRAIPHPAELVRVRAQVSEDIPVEELTDEQHNKKAQ